jgi:hypothetical protein
MMQERAIGIDNLARRPPFSCFGRIAAKMFEQHQPATG